MASLLDIGASGLRAQQAALAVTGQNITNASVEGYSRQRVELDSQVQGLNGPGFVGAGARVSDITRIVDEFIDAQVRHDTALKGSTQVVVDYLQQLDNLLFSADASLDGALRDFFGAINAAANRPESLPERSLVLAQANALTTRVNSLGSRLQEVEQGVNQALTATVERVNGLAQELADVNLRMATARDNTRNGAVNALLDQRQQLLTELSELVDTQVNQQSDGQINVLIGTGQPLLLGGAVEPLRSESGAVLIGAGAAELDISRNIAGGQLGGLLSFAQNVLQPVRNGLGRVTYAVAENVNAVQVQGLDLNGEPGRPLFADVNAGALPGLRVARLDRDSSPSGGMQLHLIDAAQTQASTYTLRFSATQAGHYQIQRDTDGALVAQGNVVGGGSSAEFDGLRLEFDADAYGMGQSYGLTPFADVATALTALQRTPQELAFADPMRAVSLPSNRGDADVRIAAVESANADTSYVLRFVTDRVYEVLDNTNVDAPQPLQPPVYGEFDADQTRSVPAPLQELLLRSDGIAATGLPSPLSLATDSPTPASGYATQNITIAGPNGSQQSVVTPDNASARQIAGLLDGLDGVVTHARTEVEVTALANNQAGLALSVAVNGQRFDDISNLDALADAIARNADLADAGVRVERSAEGLKLRDLHGGDLQIEVFGDAADSLTLTRNGVSQRVAGGGVGDPAFVVGTQDVRGGFDFSTGGPYSIQINVDGGPPATLNLNEAYADGNALRVGLQTAIDQALGPGALQVGIDAGGLLRFTTGSVGLDSELLLQPNAAAGSVLGLVTQAAQGTDRRSLLAIGGDVRVYLEPGYALDAASAGVFTANAEPEPLPLRLELEIAGRPLEGDEFVIESNSGGVLDNRNARRLLALQTDPVLDGAGLSASYALLVQDTAVAASRAQSDNAAADALWQQSIARRESISGVNLDEEAANLIRFEQAYNASAQVIAVARETFDSLLGAVA